MSRRPRVAGIVLAAGVSSRMGRPKQLLPFRGQTILECVVDGALRSPLDKVIVVLGHKFESLSSLLAERDATVVLNSRYERGQGSSVKAGLREVRGEVDAVLFLLGDQPLVTWKTIGRLIDSYGRRPSPIVLPIYNGKRGNPVLFDSLLFDRLASLPDEVGARVLFHQYADRILQVPVSDPGIHFDIDTEQDFQDLRKMEGNG